MDAASEKPWRILRRMRRAPDKDLPVAEAPAEAQAPDGDVVRELARLVVSQVAPEELPMFAVLADACLADPGRMLGSRDDVRERLGFGVGEVVALTTPFAVLAAGEVVKYVTTNALEVGRTAAGRIFRRKAKGSRRTADQEGRLPKLRDDQP